MTSPKKMLAGCGDDLIVVILRRPPQAALEGWQ
jgi:hypothetical protein